MIDKKLLKKELLKMGVPVVGNYVKRSDIKKIIASEMWENKEAMADDLVKEFSSGKSSEEVQEIKQEIIDSLDFSASARYGDWGNAAAFTADGEEYNLIESEEESEKIALKIVKQDLEHEPEIFNKDFLKEHLYITDTDKRIISNEEADARVDNMNEDDILEEAKKEDEYEAAEDEDEKEKILEDAKEELRSKYSDDIEERLKDPIKYFVNDEGIYNVEDLMKANFINVDIEEAAKAAIDADGWPHFLSHYDGNYETTNSGMVYFRE